MEALLSSEPWLTDPGVLPIPWRKSLEIHSSVQKLSFAFMDFDGVVRPHPPIARALNMVKDALRATGHEVCRHSTTFPKQTSNEANVSSPHLPKVIPWNGPSHAQALAIHVRTTQQRLLNNTSCELANHESGGYHLGRWELRCFRAAEALR